MTEARVPDASGGPSAGTVAALVEAIDVRARQAGQESASALLRGMLESVSEALAAIQDRLDHVEELLADDPTGGGAAGVTSAVQEGLAAFNARLARLEEAFVHAVDDSGAGTRAVVDGVRTVVETALAASPAGASVAAVEPAIRDVAERLDALERRLAAPPAPSRAPDVGPVLARLDALDARLTEVAAPAVDRAPSPGPAPVDLSPVLERLAGLEQVVRSRTDARADTGALVRASVAPLVERIDGLEAAARAAADAQAERSGHVDASLAALPARLTVLEERVTAAIAGVEDRPTPVVDPAVLERLEAAVERLQRDEASAQLVRLVEERLAAGMRAMAERADAVRHAVDALDAAVGHDEERWRALEAAVRSMAAEQERRSSAIVAAVEGVAGRFGTLGERLSGLDVRLESIEAGLAGMNDEVAAVRAQLEPLAGLAPMSRATADKLVEIGDRVDELVSRPSADPVAATPAERLTDVVRSEAELLTQRVAALAVGVEAARALLEQHVADTEHSVGKKASELTRRIAADFGIRTGGGSGRRASGGRRDPREIGPG